MTTKIAVNYASVHTKIRVATVDTCEIVTITFIIFHAHHACLTAYITFLSL